MEFQHCQDLELAQITSSKQDAGVQNARWVTEKSSITLVIFIECTFLLVHTAGPALEDTIFFFCLFIVPTQLRLKSIWERKGIRSAQNQVLCFLVYYFHALYLRKSEAINDCQETPLEL